MQGFNFYPRSPCGERQYLVRDQRPNWEISIHALLAESDGIIDILNNVIDYFYPRSPCGERRCFGRFAVDPPHFYPRSPCGERLLIIYDTSRKKNFYPRSPCGERPPVRDIIQWEGIFLSTLSLRRATAIQHPKINKLNDFYPRSPCGERRNNKYTQEGCQQFLSTLSLRRATMIASVGSLVIFISIHALLAESDKSIFKNNILCSLFLSTLSLRRATKIRFLRP